MRNVIGIHEELNEVHIRGTMADVLDAHEKDWYGYSFYQAFFKHDGRLMAVDAIARSPEDDQWIGITAVGVLGFTLAFYELDKPMQPERFTVIIALPLDEWVERQ